MPGTDTTIGAGEISSGIVTTTVGQVDTVTFNRDVSKVEVLNYDGKDWLFFTVDGSTPSVGGKASLSIPPAVGEAVELEVAGGGATVVKVTAATATKYIVAEVVA